MCNPSSAAIQTILAKGGGAPEIDELFYPGEKEKAEKRKAEYLNPEGTGRSRSPKISFERTYHREDRALGVWKIQKVYADGTHIGTIESVRRGFLDTFFRTQDGQEFAHWGGPTGAETYLMERY